MKTFSNYRRRSMFLMEINFELRYTHALSEQFPRTRQQQKLETNFLHKVEIKLKQIMKIFVYRKFSTEI